MLGYLDFLFLSYSGRIGRMPYWLGLLALAGVQYAICWGLMSLALPGVIELMAAHPEPNVEVMQELMMRTLVPVSIVSLIFLYPSYAIVTKRWHDRGKSGWWSLIAFVPLIGALWMLVECGFLGGEDGSNTYGPNPVYA